MNNVSNGIIICDNDGFSFKIMPLENEMKTPKSFVGVTGVLNRAFALIVIMYIGMGLFGYLKYGDAIRESITLNLETNSNVDEMYVIGNNRSSR